MNVPFDDAERIIGEAIDEHEPVKTYALFSGGNDSLVATHIAHQLTDVDKTVHINTGIGIPETRQFVRDACDNLGWDLKELHPPDKSYEDFIQEHGFPGPGAHIYAYSWLKDRAIRQLVQEAKEEWKDRVMLLTGVRTSESDRRMGHTQEIYRDGAQLWVAPIISWDREHLREVRERDNLPTNPVVEKMHMSGECLCGAFAREYEFEELEFWYPDVADRIRGLEDKVQSCGIEGDRAKWGNRKEDHAPSARDHDLPAPLCSDCGHMHNDDEDEEDNE